MKYTCITSMTKNHFDYIGGVMLESWKKYWPIDSKMIIYAEGFIPVDSDQRISVVKWEDLCLKEHEDFCKKTDSNSTRQFAKKGFAFLNAMENSDRERLIWIDADILFFKTITENLIDSIIPSNKVVALFDCYYQENSNYTLEEYIDKEKRQKMAAESGFLIVNTIHRNYNTYVSNYRNLFTSKVKDPGLDSWYDGEVAVLAARDFLIDVEDLSKLRLTNKTQTPLNKSKLSEYFNHQKGKVKKGYNVNDLRKFCNLN